ncbi:unnamed protein product [Rotaria sp. Silwood2]|nr:unnamed protein product [Rotaria sp. Silwood2]
MIAQRYNCQIDFIDVKVQIEITTLPKSINSSTIELTPKYLIEQSNQFYSSIGILKKVSISNFEIEIHRTENNRLPKIDILIISAVKDAIKESIDPTSRSLYFENDIGRRILFIPWMLLTVSDVDVNQTNSHLRKSINDFISTTLKQVRAFCKDHVITICFSTTDWENFSSFEDQFANEIFNQLKTELETSEYSNYKWKILFTFDDQQIDLYNRFSQAISSVQTNSNTDEQFYYPIASMSFMFSIASFLKLENMNFIL